MWIKVEMGLRIKEKPKKYNTEQNKTTTTKKKNPLTRNYTHRGFRRLKNGIQLEKGRHNKHRRGELRGGSKATKSIGMSCQALQEMRTKKESIPFPHV